MADILMEVIALLPQFAVVFPMMLVVAWFW